MSSGGPPLAEGLLLFFLLPFLVASAVSVGLFHLLARLTRWPASALAVVGLLALAATVTLMLAESARWMLLPDGQNEEGAFLALVVAVGAFGEAAWLAWSRRRATA